MRGFKGKMPCPTTATPVLREPAQSKCTWTCHKSHSRPKFTGNMPDYAIEMHTDMSQEPFYAKLIWKMPNANTATPSLCEPAQSKCTWTFHKSHFVRNLKGKCRKMPNANPATPVLCEPAQSKCTWTCHKSHVVWKFTGKMPDATDTTSIELRGLTLTIRTPQCGQVLGKNPRGLPSKECSHQHKEPVGLVIAALPGIPDLLVLPGPFRTWTPDAEDIQLLQLMHRGAKETCRNEHQKDGRAAHEPIHTHLESYRKIIGESWKNNGIGQLINGF